MPSIKLCDNNQTFNYTHGAELGRGAFGYVYSVNQALPNGQALVCKITNMGNNNENAHSANEFKRNSKFSNAINEINVLKQLDLLAGFKYDQTNDQFIILMHRAPGITEQQAQSDQARYASFKALRDLHRKGIAHHDGHPGNFMYDANTDKATAIDFGMATPHSLAAELYDYVRLHIYTIHGHRPEFTITKLVELYMTEIIEYIQNNKLQCAKDAFLMATITIAALSGTSVFGVGAMLAKELIKRYFIVETAHFYDCIARLRHKDGDNANDSINKFLDRTIEMLIEVSAGILLATDMASAYHHGENVFSSLSTIYNALSPTESTFWIAAAKNVSAEDLGIALMGLMPLKAAYHILTSYIERNLLTESMTVDFMNLKHYGLGNKKELLWNFGNNAANKVKTAANYIAEYIKTKPVMMG